MKSRKFPSDQSDQSDPLLGVAWTLCSWRSKARSKSSVSNVSSASTPWGHGQDMGVDEKPDFPISGAPKQEVAKDNSMVMYICIYIYMYIYTQLYTCLLMETYAKRNTGGMYSTLRETAINHRNDHSWLGFILQFLQGFIYPIFN